MDNNKTRLAIKGIVTGFLNKGVNMVLPFISRTVMIYTIGAQYLGLNSVFTSILSILSFAELGFGNVMVYSMYKPIAEHDDQKLCALLNLYKKLYRIIGTIILITGLSIMPFIKVFVHGECPNDVNLYILYGIYLFNSVSSYLLFAYKGSLLAAHQMYYVSNNASTVIILLTYASQIFSLLVFRSYYLYVVIIPLSTIANNLVIANITQKYYPNIKPEGKVDKDLAKDIKKNVLAGIGHKLGPAATTSIDNLVVSSNVGLVMAAVYNNYNFILTTVTGFISLVFGSYLAGIGNSIVTESVDKNYEDFKAFTFMNSILTGWSAICILCLSQPFMWLWVGKNQGTNYMLSFGSVIILAIMYYAQQIRSVVQSYKMAAGMWYADRYKPYVTAGANAILDILLIKQFGITGILLSTIFARACIGIPWETHAMFKNYFKRSQAPYYLSILKYAFVTVVIGAVSYIICSYIPDDTWGMFMVKAFICACITAMMFVMVYIKNEYMSKTIRRLYGFIRVKFTKR